MNVEYENLISSGKFVSGTKRSLYEKAKTPHGTIQAGDIVVWNDPDTPSYHNENYTQQLFIGKVKHCFDIEGSELELSTSMPIGRIDMDNITFISGMDIRYYPDGHQCDSKFIDQFMNSNYNKWMSVAWTFDGDFVKDGE